MAAPLSGAREKVSRALEQFNSLEAEVGPWIAGQPHQFRVDFKAETQRWTNSVENFGEEPPLRFAVIIGEIVHDLRSALDHLIWQLVAANPNGKGPSSRNQFPIYTDKAPVKRKHWATRKDRWNAMVCDVAPAERGTIKALQPYRRAHRVLYCSLAVLRDLSDTDKHNLLIATTAGMVPDLNSPPIVSFDPLPMGARFVDVVYNAPDNMVWPLPPGRTELLSFRIDPPTVYPKVRVNRRLPLTVAFGERPFPIDDILNLIAEVTMILDYFDRVIG
jgi:hypothetical protein